MTSLSERQRHFRENKEENREDRPGDKMELLPVPDFGSHWSQKCETKWPDWCYKLASRLLIWDSSAVAAGNK